MAISGNERQSATLGSLPCGTHLVGVDTDDEWQSVAISGNQWSYVELTLSGSTLASSRTGSVFVATTGKAESSAADEEAPKPRARPGLPGGAGRGLAVILRCSSGEWYLRSRDTQRPSRGPQEALKGGHVRDLEQSEHLDRLGP